MTYKIRIDYKDKYFGEPYPDYASLDVILELARELFTENPLHAFSVINSMTGEVVKDLESPTYDINLWR